jgi:hypothetical protein
VLYSENAVTKTKKIGFAKHWRSRQHQGTYPRRGLGLLGFGRQPALEDDDVGTVKTLKMIGIIAVDHRNKARHILFDD